MMSKSEMVKDAVLRHPFLISKFLGDKTFNNRMTMGIIKKMFPLRSSVEIECIGSLTDKINSFIKLENLKKNVIDFNDDRHDDFYISEHRISINGRQLKGMYNILEEMKIYCKINPMSGIHIHIDNSGFIRKAIGISDSTAKTHLLYIQAKILVEYLNDVYKIFGSRYKGMFNQKKVSVDSKDAWINVRTGLNTVEYRIGECTFEYEEIVKYMIELQKITMSAQNRAMKIFMEDINIINGCAH